MGDSIQIQKTAFDGSSGVYNPGQSIYIMQELSYKDAYGMLFMAHGTVGSTWMPDGSAGSKTAGQLRDIKRPRRYGYPGVPTDPIESIPYTNW